MKFQLRTHAKSLFAAFILLSATACQKEISGNYLTDADPAYAPITTATSPTIGVALDDDAGVNTGNSTDSVYVMQECKKGEHRDSIGQADLPTDVQSYLSANYAGNIFRRAFAVKDNTGDVKAYVVIVKFNNKPVALLFDANGVFVKVLEQREKGCINGLGWKVGGRFEKRGGLYRDTISLTSLPSTIKEYFAIHYPGDTLVVAFKKHNDGVLVITKNNGLFVNVFNKAGLFIMRMVLPLPVGKLMELEKSSIPGSIKTYLAATYPNSVVDHAHAVVLNGVTVGYLLMIDANNTRYAIVFDANGKFVALKVIW